MLIQFRPARQNQGRTQQDGSRQTQHALQQDRNHGRGARLRCIAGGPEGPHHIPAHHTRQDAVEKEAGHRQLGSPAPSHRCTRHLQQQMPAHDGNQHDPPISRHRQDQPGWIRLKNHRGKLLPVQFGCQKPECSHRKKNPEKEGNIGMGFHEIGLRGSTSWNNRRPQHLEDQLFHDTDFLDPKPFLI